MTKYVDTGCAWTKYIIVSKNDTEETKRQALDHNETRKKKMSAK